MRYSTRPVGPLTMITLAVALLGGPVVLFVLVSSHYELGSGVVLALWAVHVITYFGEPWLEERKRRRSTVLSADQATAIGHVREPVLIPEQDDERRRREIWNRSNELWRTEKARLLKALPCELDLLQRLTPERFEERVASMFRTMGYAAKRTPASNDAGIDVMMKREDRLYVVQCKRYAKSTVVGRPEIQAFVGAMVGTRADKGFFVTTSSFTSGAKNYVHDIGLDIDLIDGRTLAEMMQTAFSESAELTDVSVMCEECGAVFTMGLRDAVRECPNGHQVMNRLHRSMFEHLANEDGMVCPECGRPLSAYSGSNRPAIPIEIVH